MKKEIKILIILTTLLTSCQSVKKASERSTEKVLEVQAKDITITEQKDVQVKDIRISVIDNVSIVPASPEIETVVITPEGKKYRFYGAKEITLNRKKDSTVIEAKDNTVTTTEDKSKSKQESKTKQASRKKEKEPHYAWIWWVLPVFLILVYLAYRKFKKLPYF